MVHKRFSKGEAIKFGWKVIRNNLGFFLGVSLIIALIEIVSEYFLANLKKEGSFWAFYLISYVVFLWIDMGMINISISVLKNKNKSYSDLFTTYPLIPKYFIGSILYSLLVYIGLFLLIVPGIYLGIRFGFFRFLIVDKEVGPIEAFKISSEITKGVKWNLFLFYLLIAFINLLGFLLLIIGLFVTVPITYLASTYVYRKLLEQTQMKDMPILEET